MESKAVFFFRGSIDPGYFVHMTDEELPCYAEKKQTWNQDPKPVAENLFYWHTPVRFCSIYVGRFFRDGLIFLGGNFLNRTSPLRGQSFLVAPPKKNEINSFATLASLLKQIRKKPQPPWGYSLPTPGLQATCGWLRGFSCWKPYKKCHPILTTYWMVWTRKDYCFGRINTSRGPILYRDFLPNNFYIYPFFGGGREVKVDVKDISSWQFFAECVWVGVIFSLVGGFKDFLFSARPGEDSHFDEYFSNGLKPPTSSWFLNQTKNGWQVWSQMKFFSPLENPTDFGKSFFVCVFNQTRTSWGWKLVGNLEDVLQKSPGQVWAKDDSSVTWRIIAGLVSKLVSC